MKENKIIIFILLMFLAGSFWIFSASQKITDPVEGKNWWLIYFSDPKSDRLDFTVENYSKKENFSYEVKRGDETLEKEDFRLSPGEKKFFPLDNQKNFEKRERIYVRVTNGQEIREIYKNY